MPNSITTAFVEQFKDNIRLLYQQEGSRLKMTVMMEDLEGEIRHFERLGPAAAVLKGGRHSDTPLLDIEHSRRSVVGLDYEWATLIDRQDLLRTLINPQSSYVRQAVNALGRAMDDVIVSAAGGNARSGKDGSTLVALPSSQIIVDGGTGLTVDKLRQTKKILDAGEVPDGDRHFIFNACGLQDLLEETETTSSDFASVKALVNGEINTFMGFMFHRMERLPATGNIRSCFAWHKNAVGLAMASDIMTRIDEREDKSYATQVYAASTFGAVRLEEEGVVQIDFDESV